MVVWKPSGSKLAFISSATFSSEGTSVIQVMSILRSSGVLYLHLASASFALPMSCAYIGRPALKPNSLLPIAPLAGLAEETLSVICASFIAVA